MTKCKIFSMKILITVLYGTVICDGNLLETVCGFWCEWDACCLLVQYRACCVIGTPLWWVLYSHAYSLIKKTLMWIKQFFIFVMNHCSAWCLLRKFRYEGYHVTTGKGKYNINRRHHSCRDAGKATVSQSLCTVPSWICLRKDILTKIRFCLDIVKFALTPPSLVVFKPFP